MKQLYFSLCVFILLATVSLQAQTTIEEFSGNANYAGGVYVCEKPFQPVTIY